MGRVVTDVLSVLTLLAGGLAAGVLVGVAVANVPSFAQMPADRYVAVHQLFDRHYEPLMPLLVLGAAAVDVVLAILADEGGRAGLFTVAALALAGVAAVSQLANVPLLNSVRTVDPNALPADWPDPRPAWRRWHLARTGLSVLALAATASAVVS